MESVNVHREVITEDDLNYNLDGKIECKFYNAGNTAVWVKGIQILPGESFEGFAFTHIEAFGTVDIVFGEEVVENDLNVLGV